MSYGVKSSAECIEDHGFILDKDCENLSEATCEVLYEQER